MKKSDVAYVYLKSEPGLWTVGFFDPNGQWHSDSDWESREIAAARAAFLNGGGKPIEANGYAVEDTPS